MKLQKLFDLPFKLFNVKPIFIKHLNSQLIINIIYLMFKDTDLYLTFIFVQDFAIHESSFLEA